MSKTSAMLFAGGVLLGATVAHADPPGPGVLPLQVIAIQSDDADDQADALTSALRSRVRALHGFSLADGDYALEVLTLGFKCGETPDEACQARIADHIHADRYIWGTLKRSKTSRQVTADLHFWARGRPAIRSQSIYSDNLTTPGDEVLKRLADDMLAKLLQPKRAAAGPTLGPAAPPASAPTLAAGTVSLSGRSSVASSSGDEPVEERSNNGKRTAGWAGVGLGGVLLAAGLYSVVRVHDIDTNDRFDLYRQGFPPGDDICDKARAGTTSKIVGAATPTEMQDFCSEATTFQMLQYVFFGLGAISTGAGVYLLATDKSAPPPAQSSWKVSPSVSRSGGRLELKVTF
jgi:hypothetical protein